VFFFQIENTPQRISSVSFNLTAVESEVEEHLKDVEGEHVS
jgi:hypothetical protein